MKKVEFFLWSIFLKICMQVPMVSNDMHVKSKKSRRLVRGHQPPRPGCNKIGTGAHSHKVRASRRWCIRRWKKLFSLPWYYFIVRLMEAATRVAKMPISQGCHPSRFFYFTYILLDIIGTCMQILKKIDHRKNSNLSVWKFAAFFLTHPVLHGMNALSKLVHSIIDR